MMYSSSCACSHVSASTVSAAGCYSCYSYLHFCCCLVPLMLMLYVVSCYFFRRALSLLKQVFVPIADDVAVVAVSKNVTGTPEYIADGIL